MNAFFFSILTLNFTRTMVYLNLSKNFISFVLFSTIMPEHTKGEIELLIGRVYSAQNAIRSINPEHELLSIVHVDDTSIYWEKELYDLYPTASSDYDRLSKYASELEKLSSHL